MSDADYVKEIVIRGAQVSVESLPPQRTGQEMIGGFAKVRGLLTDEEVDTLFSRNPSFGRPVDLD